MRFQFRSSHFRVYLIHFFFFFNDTATTEIYTLSLHDALPISPSWCSVAMWAFWSRPRSSASWLDIDRKSTRLNSSHVRISYAVFCLKKKKLEYTSLYLHGKLDIVPALANLDDLQACCCQRQVS